MMVQQHANYERFEFSFAHNGSNNAWNNDSLRSRFDGREISILCNRFCLMDL